MVNSSSILESILPHEQTFDAFSRRDVYAFKLII